MEQEKLNEQYEPSNYSFTMVPDYFFRKLIKVMGAIPSMVYLSLLSYCHKNKYIAWPSLNTMSQETGMAKTTIIRNLNILIKQNFIKNIAKDKSSKNYYHHNVYQILPPEKILLSFSDAKNNAGGSSATLPSEFQNATSDGSVAIPRVVAERYPNNNNLNNNNITTTNRESVVVDFKKLKEKGEERMRVIRERMVELDFKEEFIEKILKEYSIKKIDEKLDLLIDKRNIQNHAGWLMAALKNDYRGEERERYDEEPVRQESQPIPHPHLNPPPSRGRRDGSLILSHSIRGRRFVDCPAQKEEEFKEGLETGSQLSPSKWTSREKALEAIGLIRDNLSLSVYPLSPGGKGTIAKLRGG